MQNALTIIYDSLQSLIETDTSRYGVFFRFLVDQLSQGNRLHLFSLSSKIAYLDGIYSLTDAELRAFHCARKHVESRTKMTPKTVAAFQFTLRKLMKLVESDFIDQLELEHATTTWNGFDDTAYTVIERRSFIRGVIYQVDIHDFRLSVVDEDSGFRLAAQFNVIEVNEQFNVSIRHLSERIQLPVMAHFFENRFVEPSVFISSGIVIDPDYLIDVTSIAECFLPDTELPLIHLMRQLLPTVSSIHLLIGNIANTILDRLMMGEDLSYDEFVKELFGIFALDFVLLSNEEVRKVLDQVKLLLRHLTIDVASMKRETKGSIAYIEPTFISPQYGIQGRLDALFLDATYKTGIIVELKSGKPYRTNEFGLNRNHYVQTLLYDMSIRSSFGDDFKSTNYILYSKQNVDRLKRAPTIKAVQYQTMKIRNDLVAIHHHTMQNVPGNSLIDCFGNHIFTQAGGFIARDARQINSLTKGLSKRERLHFSTFLSLLSSENYMAKIGGEITRNHSGFSSLWLKTVEEKESNFDIFRQLKMEQKLGEGLYRFSIHENNNLANFRTGDIVVLYPSSREDQPTNGQLLKGSLTLVGNQFVEIRLRNPLLQSAVFENIEYWNAEHDFIESSTRNAMRSLYSFYQLPSVKREIFMGIRPPRFDEINSTVKAEVQDENRRNIIGQMMAAQDYYLLWGPPGTGKTSIMLSALVRALMDETSESILLVGYTNRAVDEICLVLEEFYSSDYIRIGSRYAVDARYKPKLFREIIRQERTRELVRTRIEKCRIYVGTLASITGMTSLFELKKFNRLIVDEASQILEPQIIGLFQKVDSIVLIGDHKQLPAVVVSDKKQTIINIEELNEIGYSDSSMSLFERLYRRCLKNNWHFAMGQLETQGRMHEEISSLVSSLFYENKLNIIKSIEGTVMRQTQPLNSFYKSIPSLNNFIINNRVHFIHSQHLSIENIEMTKMSENEAVIVDELIAVLYPCLPPEATIGVICPFRAQIAMIINKIEKRWKKIPDRLSIDTVERYQGGARDIIILSTCAANRRTLDAIQSLDQEDMDRKLNVAMSRAREQLILIGDRRVLMMSPAYKLVIEHADAAQMDAPSS